MTDDKKRSLMKTFKGLFKTNNGEVDSASIIFGVFRLLVFVAIIFWILFALALVFIDIFNDGFTLNL
jgi:hypothetical protein